MKKIDMAQMVRAAQAQETKEEKDAKLIAMFCHIASVMSGKQINDGNELNAICRKNTDVRRTIEEILNS